MKRREYLENISAAATAPLALSAAEQAAADLSEDWKKFDTKNRRAHRRGEEGEILVYVDKFEEVEKPKLTVRNMNTGEVVDYIHIFEEYPEPHIGHTQSVVFSKFDGNKYTCFVPYYSKIKYGVKGWIDVRDDI